MRVAGASNWAVITSDARRTERRRNHLTSKQLSVVWHKLPAASCTGTVSWQCAVVLLVLHRWR